MDFSEYKMHHAKMFEILDPALETRSAAEFDRAFAQVAQYFKDNIEDAPNDVDLIKLELAMQLIHTIFGLE